MAPGPWVVTGGSGFLGRHLLDRLSHPNRLLGPCWAVGRRRPAGWTGPFVAADLTDSERVQAVVAAVQPSVVYHLAGRTPPGIAADYAASNVLTTAHWLTALADARRSVRFVLVGSAAELGPVPVEDLPVGEGYLARPVDPYGVSKLEATQLALESTPPVEALVARVFNPIGPGLPTNQALGRFAQMLAAGQGPLTLPVGDLRPRRDFVDVRDVADALIALAERGTARAIYHVGSGQSHAVGEGLDRLIALSGRDVVIRVDPTLAQSTGPLDSRADLSRIQAATGWTPLVTWEQSLADLWASVRRGSLPSGTAL